MSKKFTCIVCPRGCALEVDDNLNVTGNFCPRGKAYALSEITAPVRNIASTVRILNIPNLMLSVKTSKPIPKEKIFEVMEEINKVGVNAPINLGDVIIKNVCGLDADIIAQIPEIHAFEITVGVLLFPKKFD